MKKQVDLTADGKKALEAELQSLIKERPAIAERIAIARDFGDLKENEEYSSARNEQKVAENRILEIEEILKNAKIIKKPTSNKVIMGSTVTVGVNGKELTYSIVGPVEADPLNGKVSDQSPIGKILLGKKVGETADLVTPKTTTQYKILKIS